MSSATSWRRKPSVRSRQAGLGLQQRLQHDDHRGLDASGPVVDPEHRYASLAEYAGRGRCHRRPLYGVRRRRIDRPALQLAARRRLSVQWRTSAAQHPAQSRADRTPDDAGPSSRRATSTRPTPTARTTPSSIPKAAGVTFTYQIASDMTLKSITSYRHITWNIAEDLDGSADHGNLLEVSDKQAAAAVHAGTAIGRHGVRPAAELCRRSILLLRKWLRARLGAVRRRPACGRGTAASISCAHRVMPPTPIWTIS